MAQIEKLLKLHEDEKLKPYRCTSGKLTIGVGRNLEDNGISTQESDFLLGNDIKTARDEVEKYEFFNALDDVRQGALIDMMFNLGASRFRNFGKMILALTNNDYKKAAEEMLDSRWALQVGMRAVRLSKMMRTGEWPQDI